MEPIEPEILRPWIVEPRVAYWGTGNRICLWCYDPPETFPDDDAYSEQFGVAGMPEYTDAPARAKLREGDRFQLEELDWGEQGFIISDRPLYSCS